MFKYDKCEFVCACLHDAFSGFFKVPSKKNAMYYGGITGDSLGKNVIQKMQKKKKKKEGVGHVSGDQGRKYLWK